MKRPDDTNDENAQSAGGGLFRRKPNPSSQAKPNRWVPQTSFRSLGGENTPANLADNQSLPAQGNNALPPVKPPQKAAPIDGARQRFDWGKLLAAFWTVASVLSLVINVVLILALVLVGRELFTLKSMVGNNLLGGLYENFIFMDQAHIKTNISVADNVPINFNLPISQDTVVVLTEDTRVNGAMVRLNSGGVSINSVANIVLPAGTNLPVHLELNVPVNTTVPIKINVPVDIPLANTDLHKPFIGLQQVVAPFYNMLMPQIEQPSDVGVCQTFSFLCSAYFKQP